jgi:hypothetical protein
MWFGLQVIISCATTWVSFVATGPLQAATHDLRFPLIICLIFLTAPLVLECCRARMGVFKKDMIRWREDRATKEASFATTELTVAPAAVKVVKRDI